MQAILEEPKRVKKNYRDDTNLPTLSGGAKSVLDIKGFWAIARCRTNHEKTLALIAEDAGFSYCLPMREELKPREGHGPYKTCSIAQNLRGYVFLASELEPEPGFHVSTDLWYFLADNFSTKGREIIQVKQSRQIHFAEQLEAVRRSIATEKPVEGFIQGVRCRVVKGPWMGKEGVISRCGKKGFVELRLDELQTVHCHEISTDRLEPLVPVKNTTQW